MKISSLIDIVEGKLENKPSISFVTKIHINIAKIDDGDAFIVSNKRDIPRAIEQGAFAILYENSVDIIDTEIAWVQIPSVQKAMTNILRYKFSKQESIQFFYVDKILYHFLEIFKSKDFPVVLLKDNLKINFETIISKNITQDSMIFSYDNYFLQKVFPAFKILQPSKHSIYNLTSFTLFDTTFSYKGVLFNNLKIPKLYIDHFLTIYNFFDKKIDLKKVNNFALLKPLFINRSLHIVPNGQSNRFILANKNIDICRYELRYLNKEYRYGTIKVIDKQKITNEQILRYLKKYTTNIIYFKYIDISTIEAILLQNNQELSLF